MMLRRVITRRKVYRVPCTSERIRHERIGTDSNGTASALLKEEKLRKFPDETYLEAYPGKTPIHDPESLWIYKLTNFATGPPFPRLRPLDVSLRFFLPRRKITS